MFNRKWILTILSASAFYGGANSATIYIESNRGDNNSLLSFDLTDTGNIQPINEVPTMGKGIVDPSLALGPFDSDQEIVYSKERHLLFAVNSGSNSIAVFHLDYQGRLKPVSGSPFYSHGINPVSVGLQGNILTVVNKHQDPSQAMDLSLPNYTNFLVNRDGTLVWTGSVVSVALGSSPSQALVTPFGSLVIGADFLGGLLRSLTVNQYGGLSEAMAIGLPEAEFTGVAAPRLPLGLAAHPATNVVYVGFPTAKKIGIYKYGRFGQLDFVRSTPDSGAVVCWLTVNSSGTRLYASNTGDSSVTVYDIAMDPQNPIEIQKVSLRDSMGGAYQFALSPDGKNLVILTQRFQASTPQGNGNELHVLNVDGDGKLTELVSPIMLKLPMDVRPQGVVVL